MGRNKKVPGLEETVGRDALEEMLEDNYMHLKRIRNVEEFKDYLHNLLIAAENLGFDAGEELVYEEAYSEGHDVGYAEGLEDGYEDGFEKGQEHAW